MKCSTLIAICSLVSGLAACGSTEVPVEEPVEQAQQTSEELDPPPEPEPLPGGIAPLVEPWTGDLDGMVKRRVVRVLTVHSPVLYFVDRGRELGIIYEAAKALETQLNEKLKTGNVKVYTILIPVARDELIPRLLAGQGDIAAAMLTVTPERSQVADFSDPTATGITEIL